MVTPQLIARTRAAVDHRIVTGMVDTYRGGIFDKFGLADRMPAVINGVSTGLIRA